MNELVLWAQWYDNGRERGMGREQAINRALTIVHYTEEEAEALIHTLYCDNDPAQFVDVICKGSPDLERAFKVNGSWYCSCCGSDTKIKAVT